MTFLEEEQDALARRIRQRDDFKQWLNSQGVVVAFTTPDDLRVAVTNALHAWLKRHPEYVDDSVTRKRGPDPRRYLQSLLAFTDHLDIRGLVVGNVNAHRAPIEELYISLQSARSRGAGESGSLANSLRHPRLVVTGDPGSGKTTFLRRVACAACRVWLEGNQADARWLRRTNDEAPWLPVFLRASDLTQHIQDCLPKVKDLGELVPSRPDSPDWMFHFLARDAASSGLDADYFREQFENGDALLLVDGLDETPDRESRAAVARLVERVAKEYSRCRIVVTCRPAAYEDDSVLAGFTVDHVDHLSDGAIEVFLRRWCGFLFKEDTAGRESHLSNLLSSLAARPDLRRIVRNPVMLTALAVVHWNERRLPEQRADLYKSVITWLARSREQRSGRPSAEAAVRTLEALALAMHQHPAGRQAQVPKRWAAEQLCRAGFRSAAAASDGGVPPDCITQATEFLTHEENDSGIVIGRGNDVRFWHLTFQEYLAARAIGALDEESQRIMLWSTTAIQSNNKRVGVPHLYQPEWREVMLLLAGVLHEQGAAKVNSMVSWILDDLGGNPALVDSARAIGLLGGVFRDLAPLGYQPIDPRYHTLREQVMGIFELIPSQSVPVKQRIEAAEALGQTGDPRLEGRDGRRWIDIPGGTFLRGAQSSNPTQPNFDQEARDREGPVCHVTLSPFSIARYPVTVAEYQRFVDSDGYAEPQYWQKGGRFKNFEKPERWENQLEFPNRPVVGVSWHEAMAFAEWSKCRLPTEAEWERAARGTTARKYAWGNEPQDEERCNFQRIIGAPTPVGIYPRGATPEGVDDMTGNVWEWCADWYGPYEPTDRTDPSGPERGDYRVVRGGSWLNLQRFARAAFRNGILPADRDYLVGFRLVGAFGLDSVW